MDSFLQILLSLFPHLLLDVEEVEAELEDLDLVDL